MKRSQLKEEAVVIYAYYNKCTGGDTHATCVL